MTADDLEAMVAELTRQRPDWLIWWSSHTGRFWGLGWMLYRPDGPVRVTGQDPRALLHNIDVVERLYPKHPAPWRNP